MPEQTSVEGTTVQNTQPDWGVQRQRAPRPNIVTIVLDDVGFSQLGCYGSAISTPNIDALAEEGVRLNNFHVAALCSPTRASLLSGRNHHAVGMGFLADFDTGFPGYRGAVTEKAALFPEMLRQDGYGTYAVGKWHLTPPSEMTPAGPFENWPTGRGFNKYYGFLWGEDDQWAPEIYQDQHYVGPPDVDDYHLSEDLAQRSIDYISDHISAAPDRPFYLYLALGACHAPHQAPLEYIDKYKGAFDHGWDEEREAVLERQKKLGIVPTDTRLPRSNSDVRAWDSLRPREKELYTRMQEVFAGFMEHTDDQIGRLLEFLNEQSILDDTIVVLLSDNGASGEGGRDGSANEYRYFLGLEDSFEDTYAQKDELGGPTTHNHYPSGWAQVGNTPLKMYKKFTYGGGVRAPLILRWPNGFKRRNYIERRFQHVVDIVPTLLDLINLESSTMYRGVEQMPLHGKSFARNLQSEIADTAARCQYFETAGYRAFYKDGYKAVANHQPGTDYSEDVWELYDLENDFSETKDLALKHPQLLKRLVSEWWVEAKRYGVLPLDDRMQDRIEARNPETKRAHYRFLPGVRIPNGAAGPDIGGRDFTITVSLREFEGLESGVLLAYGRRAAGFSLYMNDGVLNFEINAAGQRSTVTSDGRIEKGTTSLGMSLLSESDGAFVRLTADGTVIKTAPVVSSMPAGLGCLSLQVGYNAPSPVSSNYASPNEFTGQIKHADLELGEVQDATAAINAALRME